MAALPDSPTAAPARSVLDGETRVQIPLEEAAGMLDISRWLAYKLAPLRGFYRRPSGGPSGYCRLCQREVSRAARRRHMQDPAAVAKVRARDRARKRRGRGGDAA